MRRIITLSLLAAGLFASRGAFAQPLEGNTTATIDGTGPARGLGLGVAAMLSGPAGLSVAYDAGLWHLDTMFALAKAGGGSPGNRVQMTLGGRFWFHLHRTSSSDFSVGGGLGFTHDGPSDNDILHIDGGAQLRAFLVSNVAFAVTAGLAVNAMDANLVALDGQFIGAAAIHYYFH
jgi:hypothetical protein